MKQLITILLCLVATCAFSQKKTGWTELDDFHDIVSPVFHTAEKGNYKAAKDSATLVLERAKKWQAAPLPAQADATVFKPLIDRLVIETTAIKVAVEAKKTDEELKLILRKAHNTFHEILGKYNKLTTTSKP